MRLASLLPFAALGVLVVVVSSVALFASSPGGLGQIAEPQATPTPAGTARVVPELSKTARLAYWREGSLWVSGLDGSLRRTVTPVDDHRRITHLTWSPDGEKVAYIDARASVAIVGVDGERSDASLSVTQRSEGWRIADIRWSPRSTRIAATFLHPVGGWADAWVTDLAEPRPVWTRATGIGDLFVSDWISETKFLASTASGVIAVVTIPDDLVAFPSSVEIRPITGTQGVSPILTADGRVHFLAGRVPTTRDPSVPYLTASRASVWSADLDGSDVRRETVFELNDVRLDARLPDGRYLVHRGGTPIQSITGQEVVPLPVNAGLIERVRLAPDGRTAYGFTHDRVVQLDLTKVASPAATPEPQASVFLDTIGDADIWFPPTAWTPALGPGTTEQGPIAKYAFVLGGHLWTMGADGTPDLLRPAEPIRRTAIPLPRWSPNGDRLLAIEQAGRGAPINVLVPVMIDVDGEHTRLETVFAATRSFAWSPDGSEIAIVVDKRGISGLQSNAQLEVRSIDAAGLATRDPISGVEVAWTTRGRLVLSEVGGERVLQLWPTAGGPRTVVGLAALITDERVSHRAWMGGAWSSLDATADGSWLSLQITTADMNSGYLVLMDAAGRATVFVDLDDLADARWSPTEPLIGYTLDLRGLSERAVIHDPAGGELVSQQGRFAGWSPDGEWYYVARTAGLYAFRLDGGSGVRVSSVGTPIAATLP